MVEWKKLGDICDFLKGRSLSKNDIGLGESQVILYGELYTTYGDYITSIRSKTSSEIAAEATKLEFDDLVLPVSSTTKEAQIGKVSVIKEKADISLGSDAIILRNSFNSNFLMYYLNSTLFEREKMNCVHGTTIMHLSPKELAQKTVPIPSVSEQQRIVDILDTFTSTIENLKQQIALRRKQYEYYRDKLLDLEGKEGVVMKTLGDIMQIVRGASPRPIQNYITREDDGVNWIKIGDVSPNDKYITKTNEKITREGANKSRILHPGAFILSNSMSFGRPYILQIDGCIHDGWIAMSEYEKYVSSGYLYEILNADTIQRYWNKKANNGGAMTNLNSDIVRETPIPIPSSSEQQRIVYILDTFEVSIANLEAQLAQREKQYEYYRNKLLTFE